MPVGGPDLPLAEAGAGGDRAQASSGREAQS